MATQTASAAAGSRISPHTSLSSYKSATDTEVRAYSQSLSQYERSLEQATRKASKPARFPFMRSGESRTSDSRTVNKILREWENDRTMAAIVGNGERAERHHGDSSARGPAGHGPEQAFRQEQPGNPRHPQATRTSFADEDGLLDHVVGFLSNVRQIPVMLAAALAIATVMSALFVPATVVTGLLASPSMTLPLASDADQALFDYSSPMSEDMMTADLSQVDTHKFDMLSLREYVVQPGDSIGKIANYFNLKIDTIISFNNITNPRGITSGTKYKIPNRDGLSYKVLAKDTLESIAKKFGVTVTSLLDGNNLSDVNLVAGTSIFVPEARMNAMDLKLLLGELFIWPVYGDLSSRYGYRTDPFTGVRMFHNGIDLSGPIGSPVRAGMEGRVVDIESQVGNYGKMIIIQHPRGFKTLYGHLSAFKVEVGQIVSQGQIIGLRGNSGRSTGPHTHFSVIRNGEFVNPLNYLK